MSLMLLLSSSSLFGSHKAGSPIGKLNKNLLMTHLERKFYINFKNYPTARLIHLPGFLFFCFGLFFRFSFISIAIKKTSMFIFVLTSLGIY